MRNEQLYITSGIEINARAMSAATGKRGSERPWSHARIQSHQNRYRNSPQIRERTCKNKSFEVKCTAKYSIQAPDIRRQALHEGKSVSKARNYGPRELDKGTIASPECTITVFIPLAAQTVDTQGSPTVLYQPNKDKAESRQPLPWNTDKHIQIPGNSRIVVEKGPVCFDMVQYDWEPAKGQKSRDE